MKTDQGAAGLFLVRAPMRQRTDDALLFLLVLLFMADLPS
jgi:hypothetical protein